MNAENTLNLAREQLERYEKSSESWKEDHEAAQRCLDFEGLLAYGVSLVRFIDAIDLAWRTKVLQKQLPHDAKMEEAIDCLYRGWLYPRERMTKRLESFEEQGFLVSGADEFRQACREVKGILTPDGEFFAGNDALLRKQDEAVEAHGRGETVELRELSD